MSGNKGSGDARRASELNTRLFNEFADVGKPALAAGLNYARGALAQDGLPGYVESAYRQAQAGARDQNAQDLSGLRAQIASRGDASQLGGAFLSGQAGAVGSAGDALTREVAGIRTSRAVAGVEQRNKLLGILAGGAASATSLSAGFGALGNQAISLNQQPNQTSGLIAGGLSLGTGLYSALMQQQQQSPLGFQIGRNGAGAGVGADYVPGGGY